MLPDDTLELSFVVWVFAFQLVLILHFALRKRYFDTYTMKSGWVVYALAIPAILVSLTLLLGNRSWAFWLGGFIHAIWAIYGYRIDYQKGIQWRKPINWSVFWPYVTLYLATMMFYWWPLGLISRELWFAFAALFLIGTVLNITSH